MPSHPRLHPQREIILQGLAVSPGIVIGPAQVVDRGELPEIEERHLEHDEVERELARFEEAVEMSREQVRVLREDFARNFDNKLAGIFDAHLLILDDPLVIEATRRTIRTEMVDAPSAFNKHVQILYGRFRQLNDPYFQARSSDLMDVSYRVLNNLSRCRSGEYSIEHARAVIIAHDLMPSDTVGYDATKVAAFVTDKGGPTSHTAILAKSLGIPAIVGLERATRRAIAGEVVIVDAIAGRVIINPSPETLDRYTAYIADYERHEARLMRLADQPAETPDGFRVELAANIELPDEIRHMGRYGAKSIGLYRTEFLFLGDHQPDEEQQVHHYVEAIESVGPKGYVIFRTLDLGGDKNIPALPTYEEANPFLGLRAIRLCLQHDELLMPQLRALLRASARGNARIMFPMVGSLEELRAIKAKVREAMEQLDRAGLPYDHGIEFGIMVEIPGAALMADVLANELSFFSIGTNDLIQYTLAVDRINDLVAYLYNPYHPSVLRLIHTVIVAAHRNGIIANLCGEMASDPVAAILLLGMGVDELSMASSQIPIIKEVIRSFRLDTARDIAREALAQGTSEEVRKVIEERIVPNLRHIRMPVLDLPAATE